MMLAKSLQSAAGNAAGAANYIESVFQTWLYTGNGSTQTITNGIDLAGEGGLVWIKERNDSNSHTLFDTLRGGSYNLSTNSINPSQVKIGVSVSFSSSGFTLTGADGQINQGTGNIYASWTFRKQPKFFDVVTFTGNSTSGRQISHSLGSAPGCIIVKNLTNADEWLVWHRSLGDFGGAGKNLVLNSTAAVDTGGYFGTAANQTSTYFTVNADTTKINWSGNTYVAYLFAHDSGGFGLSGEDNVISCGSFTTDGSGNATVTLGYEPQFIIRKASSTGDNWHILDTMRGWVNSTTAGASRELVANSSAAEGGVTGDLIPTATGFTTSPSSSLDPSTAYIYIAIRRGPMKVPESGTEVFAPVTRVGTVPNFVSNFPVDLLFYHYRPGGEHQMIPRLTTGKYLKTESANAEEVTTISQFDYMGGVGTGNPTNTDVLGHLFRRAPSFFDVVCYTGTGSATTFNHNLTVVPELMIAKNRGDAQQWLVYSSALGASSYLRLNSNAASASGTAQWDGTTPTSTVFSVGTSAATNEAGYAQVMYLFASCPGVSKCGSYTGTGTTLQINCGFTTGARFVLIKRTDSTGDWYVWDSARGIVAGNDPYLLLNTTDAEVTGTDYVDTYSAGFEISSTAPAAINASGGTFVFLAIA